MTPAEQIASERWVATDAVDCSVVVEGTGRCVAVIGDPYGAPTEDDRHRLSLVAAAPALLAAVRVARRQFAFYADQHRTKGTADGARKADTNDGMVAICDQVIEQAVPGLAPLPKPGGGGK